MDRVSVLQFTHMACKTLEDTPVFLLKPCDCVQQKQIDRQRWRRDRKRKIKLAQMRSMVQNLNYIPGV